MSIPILARFFGRPRLRFTYLSGPPKAGEYQKLLAEPGWQAATANVAPEIHLTGLVRPAKNHTAPWVLYYPGNDATQLRRGQRFLIALAGEHDWGLAVFAYRGYDSSNGVPRLNDLATDAGQILLQLCERQSLSLPQVHVVGFSIGGYLAVRALAGLPRAAGEPASLSLLAPAADIVMLRKSRFQRLSAGDDVQLVPYLNDVRSKVLVVQGDLDEALGGAVQGRMVASALGDRAQYRELRGLGHNRLIAAEAALAEVRRFIETK